MTDVAHPAYRALSKVGRRALHVVERQTGNGSAAPITREKFQQLAGLSPASATKAKRELVQLGFVQCHVGPRQAIVFERTDDWRRLDADEAARRVAAARGKPQQGDGGVL